MTPMDRREFLFSLSSGAVLLGSAACGRRPSSIPKERPNILRFRLEEWMERTGDLGRFTEDPAVVQRWTQEARERRERFMAQRGLALEISDEEYLKWWEGELFE